MHLIIVAWAAYQLLMREYHRLVFWLADDYLEAKIAKLKGETLSS